MRTSQIAFAAGGGGAISGWVLAAMLGAAQAQPENSNDAENGQPAEAQVSEESSGGDRPELQLKSTPIIEGPISEYSYRVGPGEIQTTLNETDLFAWVYPEFAIIGPTGSNEVMVVPRENLVAIKMFDLTENPRQKYRKIAENAEQGERSRPQEEQVEQDVRTRREESSQTEAETDAAESAAEETADESPQ